MKSITHGLLEDITDPFSVFDKEPKAPVIQEDTVEDAQIIEPSANSIKEEFNRANEQDRVMFLKSLVSHEETCKNLILLMKSDPKAKQFLANQNNTFPGQYAR